MKVLWICNMMPAIVAQELRKQGVAGIKVPTKEGWISGAMEQVRDHGDMELVLAFPVKSEELHTGKGEGFSFYGFYEDTDHPEEYDPSLEGALGHICEEVKPDVICCFGTEFPHTLAMLKIPDWKEKVLIHIQGVMWVYAQEYYSGLPDNITEKATFRDMIRKDAIWQQKDKYEKRAHREEDALRLAKYVCGRTAFDKASVEAINPSLTYYTMNETLRHSFYESQWDPSQAQPHKIFVAQGNTPIKGLHYMLEAMIELKNEFPDIELVVAGDDVIRGEKPLDTIKRSGYGKYLRDMIRENGLSSRVTLTGPLGENHMRSEFLESGLYVLPSQIENSPNSLGEAMLLGVPCVAANTGGVPSMAEDGVEVLLFEKGNSQDLADKIRQIFRDPEMGIRLGQAARKRALMTHDPAANYKMMLWAYEDIVRRTAG